MDVATYVGPPPPSDPADAMRMQFEARGWRMMYGVWERDLDEMVLAQVGHVRREAWGALDQSSNVKRRSCADRATLYDPIVDLQLGEFCWTPTHRDAETDPAAAVALATMTELLVGASASALLQRNQRDTIGIRECLIAPEVDDSPDEEGEPALVLRRVWAHMVVAVPMRTDQSRPQRLEEWRLRMVEERPQWCRDVYEIGKPMRVLDASGADISSGHADAGIRGIPHVIYHAALTGQLWDPYEESELYWGTLAQAVQWTLYGHALLDASWSQRYAIGLVPVGGAPEGTPEGGRTGVVTDPASLLLLTKEAAFEGQPVIGQFSSAVDVEKFQKAVAAGEARLVASSGLDAADGVRVVGDVQSGYALAISREAKERSARRYAPAFRRGDEQLLRSIAVAYNIWATANRRPALPLSGWGVRYPFELAAEAAQKAAEAKVKPPPAPGAPPAEAEDMPEADDMSEEIPAPRGLPAPTATTEEPTA